ncbi:MAG: hypothetical protein KGJ48_05155, partial [Nitrospirota bacterium]|nr:hypothetical protein [Nitrospirota bacterium]
MVQKLPAGQATCVHVRLEAVQMGAGKLKFPPIIHEDEAVILNVCVAARGTVVLADKLYRRSIRANSI